jgi:hypothetical protein
MIGMDQYEYIRTAYRVYGKSIREIERETGHDRKTIRKVLRGEYCGYSKRESQPHPALGEFLEIIDGWLEEDKGSHKKQRHTAARVYRRLVSEHGFSGSESTVCQYVGEDGEFGKNRTLRLSPGQPRAIIEMLGGVNLRNRKNSTLRIVGVML